MRLNYLLAIALLAAVAQAREPRHYQSGKLMRMESVKCGTDEKNGKSMAGELIGTDSQHMKTHELLCQEYVLETDTLVYHVRPKDDKHPALLPVGEKAQFRLDKDKMLLRVVRDSRGAVSGFTLTVSRVRDLEFVRRERARATRTP